MKETSSWREKNRTFLKDVVPLDTPFSITIETAATCNAKCIYCMHSVRNFGGIMSMDIFNKIINDIKKFPKKIKKLDLFGFGEPLCDPKLSEKIAISKEANITDNIAFITNGLLITPPLVDSIIQAGINNIRISLQGLDAETYKKVCGVTINFDKFIENLTYLYENKKQCTVQMKIADIALKNVENGRERLQEIFGNISDGVYVEHIFDNFSDINYDDIDPLIRKQNRLGELLTETNISKVCGRQFWALFISYDGSIRSSCCDPQKTVIYGNVNTDSIIDVWNGKKRNNFLRFQLEGKRFQRPECKDCQSPDDIGGPEDILDPYADEILQKLNRI